MDIAIINLISTILNVFFLIKLRSIQVNKELISDLREANEDKDKIIRNLHEKLNQYKKHNEHLVGENKKNLYPLDFK